MLPQVQALALRDDFVQRAPVALAKIQAQLGGSRQDSMDLLGEVVRFLWLCSKSPNTLSPSARIDLAWHEMILCTRSYQAWCHEQLGTFIHHSPSAPGQRDSRAFFRTLQLYELYFGDLPLEIWGLPQRPAGLADCGSCESLPTLETRCTSKVN